MAHRHSPSVTNNRWHHFACAQTLTGTGGSHCHTDNERGRSCTNDDSCRNTNGTRTDSAGTPNNEYCTSHSCATFQAVQTTQTAQAIQNTQLALASGATSTAQVEQFQATSTVQAPTVQTLLSASPTPLTATNSIVVSNERPVDAPIGWPIEQASIQLNVVRADIRTSADSEPSAIHMWMTLLNKSPERILVEMDHNKIHLQDAAGTRYVDWDGPGTESFYLDSNQLRIIDRYYTIQPGERSRVPSSAIPVTITVDQLATIQDAHWVVGGPPVRTYIEGSAVGEVGSTQPLADFQITLEKFDVRTSADSEPAAFHAWFIVRNSGSQRKVLEIDRANIFIEDSNGRRYIDYDGGGFNAIWLDPGQEYRFDRFYTTTYGERSRIPDNVSYIVVISEGIGGGGRIQWRAGIN